MQFEFNKSLKALNSLGFDQSAERFISVNTDAELAEVVDHANKQRWPILMLGGGSNIVLTRDVPGLVVQLGNTDLQYQPRKQCSQADKSGPAESPVQNQYTVTIGAGANWHQAVQHTLARGLNGLENLSLIPGNAGAAPVQNIGAYGVELADRFETLTALHLPTNEWHRFDKSACEFAYRNSVFKRMAGEFAITSVRLQVGDDIALETNYASLQLAIEKQDGQVADAAAVSALVCNIRRQKLPDPATLGNAGSFFHNPVVSAAVFADIEVRYPDMVAFKQADGSVKLAAGWMIDSLGMRGHQSGAVAVYDKQALVLVHHGGGTGEQLLQLAKDIQMKVEEKFGVQLNIEPLII